MACMPPFETTEGVDPVMPFSKLIPGPVRIMLPGECTGVYKAKPENRLYVTQIHKLS